MFTGIIEALGVITHIEEQGTNKTFKVKSPLSSQLKVDQSLSHNGVCLTVEAVNGDTHQVTAIAETLQKSNLGSYKSGDKINLERCLEMNGRLDGHMVQGHVDTTGILIEFNDIDGSWLFNFTFPEKFAHLLIEKGSVCINGISLTAFNVTRNSLQVAIIPYTYEHTNLHDLEIGSQVNIEFDIVGKYLSRWKELDHL
jgi:riboflavin synthase